MTSERTLIVEDEPNIAESLRFILERAGLNVDTVSHGLEALDRIRREPFVAVVLDLMLPGLNGLDVLKSIRSESRLSALPVVVLTAKGQMNDRKAAEAFGANAFIAKPFSNAEVVEKVRSLVRS